MRALTKLRSAIAEDRVKDVCDILLMENISLYGIDILSYPVKNNNLAMVELLMYRCKGIDPHAQDSIAFEISGKNRNYEMLRALASDKYQETIRANITGIDGKLFVVDVNRSTRGRDLSGNGKCLVISYKGVWCKNFFVYDFPTAYMCYQLTIDGVDKIWTSVNEIGDATLDELLKYHEDVDITVLSTMCSNNNDVTLQVATSIYNNKPDKFEEFLNNLSISDLAWKDLLSHCISTNLNVVDKVASVHPMFMPYGIDGKSTSNPFNAAVLMNDIESLNILIKKTNLNPSMKNNEALTQAKILHFEDCIKVLESVGCSVPSNNVAAATACMGGGGKIVGFGKNMPSINSVRDARRNGIRDTMAGLREKFSPRPDAMSASSKAENDDASVGCNSGIIDHSTCDGESDVLYTPT